MAYVKAWLRQKRFLQQPLYSDWSMTIERDLLVILVHYVRSIVTFDQVVLHTLFAYKSMRGMFGPPFNSSAGIFADISNTCCRQKDICG